MPDIDTMKTSNYLKKHEVGDGVLVTIVRMEKKDPPQQSQEDKPIWLLYLKEFQKPVWTNPTHREQIANLLGSRNSDDWPGQQIVLWNDPSVFHLGKTGAIRVKAANSVTVQQQSQGQNNVQPAQPAQASPPDFPTDDPGY